MRVDVLAASPTRLLGLGPALALLLSGCGADSGKCQVYGLDVGREYETYASNIAIVDGGSGGNLLLYAASGRTKQWHVISKQGSVGPRLGTARHEYLASSVGEWTHRVFAWELGFRVLRDHFVEYVVPNQPVEQRAYRSAGAPLPESFSVALPHFIRGEIYLIWVAREGSGTPETWIAGLGRLERDDRVVPIGSPFLRTTQTPNSFGFFLPGGGWDEEAGHFWIDHPDRAQVLKVSLDGALLGSEPIVGDMTFPYLHNWVKLPSGRWLGQHFSWLLQFTPTERWKAQALPNTIPGNSVGTYTQLMDRVGTVWLAGTANRQVSIRLYDPAFTPLSEPMISPLSVQDCGLFLDTY
jgi:hypothetical protein